MAKVKGYDLDTSAHAVFSAHTIISFAMRYRRKQCGPQTQRGMATRAVLARGLSLSINPPFLYSPGSDPGRGLPGVTGENEISWTERLELKLKRRTHYVESAKKRKRLKRGDIPDSMDPGSTHNGF